jgi:hypothetical protein
MTIHQCPKCELRFTWKTELDDHCANDHPQFKHEYPVRKPAGTGRHDQPGTVPAPTRGTT